VGFGGGDHVVEALEAVGAGIDYRGLAGDEGLEPDGSGSWNCCYVVEAPDSEDFEAGLRGLVLQKGILRRGSHCHEMCHDQVYVSIVRQERNPVGIGASEIALLAVDDKFQTGSSNIAPCTPSRSGSDRL
jgi:hypothetical protein